MSTATQARSTDPAGRLVYLAAMVGVFIAGVCFPFLGLALSLVLERLIFKARPGDAKMLNLMGLATLLWWLALGIFWLVSS